MSGKNGWIAVDLDGTLAHYEGWHDGQIGEPVPAMAYRVGVWIAAGEDVRIFTARVGLPSVTWEGYDDEAMRASVAEQFDLINAWSLEHFGQELPVTATKDFAMKQLWDDRCVQVEVNTGRRMDGAEDAPTERQWQEAKAHFDKAVHCYEGLSGTPGSNVSYALIHVFAPLEYRYGRGERSQDLYDEMVGVE
ncbi:MAG: hypothetical protein ACRYFS_03595 [Janthinobacterium lividum]